MYRALSGSFIAALLLGGLSGTAVAQSQSGVPLGDVARANRAQQQAQDASGAAPKVITNQDLPAGSRPVSQPDTPDPMSQVSGVERPNRFAEQPNGPPDRAMMAGNHAGSGMRGRIQEQESRIAEMQARIDRVNASMHSMGTSPTETPTNRHQAMQMQRLTMMQEMLSQQKQRLAMMEDAARHSGMGQ